MGKKEVTKTNKQSHIKRTSCVSPLFFHTRTNLTAAFCCLLACRASARLHCVHAWTSGSIQYNTIQHSTTQYASVVTGSMCQLLWCFPWWIARHLFSVCAQASDVSVNRRAACLCVCVMSMSCSGLRALVWVRLLRGKYATIYTGLTHLLGPACSGTAIWMHSLIISYEQSPQLFFFFYF